MSNSQMEDLNTSIKERIEQDTPRKKLLAYALDQGVLPEDAYSGFPAFIKKKNGYREALIDVPYVTQLFWVKAFFEKSNGYNIWKVFRNAINVDFSHNDLRWIADRLPYPFADVDEFRKECWLVGGNPDQEQVQGETSQLWKFLVPLVRSIPEESSTDQIIDYAHQFLDGYSKSTPSFFSDLIESNDPTFLKSLQALRAQTGTGWLEKISGLWSGRADRPGASAGWMLYINGNQQRLDLVVRNIFIPENGGKQLVLKQGNHVLVRRDINGEQSVHFPVNELIKNNLSEIDKIQLYFGRIKVDEINSLKNTLSADHPPFFRYPLRSNSHWLALVEEGEHISSRRIAVLLPSETEQQFQIGGINISFDNIGRICVGQTVRTLAILQFDDDLAGSDPRALNLNGNKILTIGSKPYLEIPDACSEIQCLDYASSSIVLGNSAKVVIKRLPDSEQAPEWRCEGGTVKIDADGAPIITPKEVGVPVKIVCGDVRETIIFLPKEAFDENGADGWKWVPEEKPEEIVRYAEDGMQVGSVSNENIYLRFSRPLGRAVWWWKKGIFGVPECVDTQKDFNNHTELVSFRFCCWVPEGISIDLKLGQTQIKEKKLVGPTIFQESVGGLLDGYLTVDNIGEAVDVLYFGDAKLAHILRVPSRPTILLTEDKEVKVFFPENDFSPAEYSVVCLFETGIKNDEIEVVSCAQMKPGQLNPVQLNHTPTTGEGVWGVLVHGNNLSGSLLDFAFAGCHVEGAALPVQRDNSAPLFNRLGIEAGSIEANKVRGILDVLNSRSSAVFEQGVFAQAIRDRMLLAYSNRPEFWNSYFSEHCQLKATQTSGRRGRPSRNALPPEQSPAPLEQTLSLMLRAGFNWCAEPNWFNWAYHKIPEAMEWKKMTVDRKKKLKQALGEICLPILAQKDIEVGAIHADENGFDHGLLTTAKILGLRCPDLDSSSIWNQGQAIDGFKQQEKSLIGKIRVDRHDRPVSFCYHGENRIDSPFSKQERFIGALPNDQRFSDFMLDGKDLGDQFILEKEKSDRLADIFKKGLKLAASVLGTQEDRGLGYMFMLAANGFQEWGQSARVDIFQAAVLCRLHAWLGWRANPGDRAPEYPDSWPLSDSANYDLVCDVVRSAWHDDDLRKMLIKDLIPIEWMIAWFHC